MSLLEITVGAGIAALCLLLGAIIKKLMWDYLTGTPLSELDRQASEDYDTEMAHPKRDPRQSKLSRSPSSDTGLQKRPQSDSPVDTSAALFASMSMTDDDSRHKDHHTDVSQVGDLSGSKHDSAPSGGGSESSPETSSGGSSGHTGGGTNGSDSSSGSSSDSSGGGGGE